MKGSEKESPYKEDSEKSPERKAKQKEDYDM